MFVVRSTGCCSGAGGEQVRLVLVAISIFTSEIDQFVFIRAVDQLKGLTRRVAVIALFVAHEVKYVGHDMHRPRFGLKARDRGIKEKSIPYN